MRERIFWIVESWFRFLLASGTVSAGLWLLAGRWGLAPWLLIVGAALFLTLGIKSKPKVES